MDSRSEGDCDMFKASAMVTYHSIDHSGSVISTSPAVFERQMEALAACGVPVVPLDRVTRANCGRNLRRTGWSPGVCAGARRLI